MTSTDHPTRPRGLNVLHVYGYGFAMVALLVVLAWFAPAVTNLSTTLPTTLLATTVWGTLALGIALPLTNVIMGDFNSAPSGAHGGDRDWEQVPAHKRRQKARLVQDFITGQWLWIKDTVPLDTLIGPWAEQVEQRRTDLGAGYRTLAELDWEQRGRPGSGLVGTTVTAQSLPIDHILTDDSVELLPGSFAVHLNPHSDHGVLHARTLIHPRQGDQ